MKKTAEDYLGQEVKEAVITVEKHISTILKDKPLKTLEKSLALK